MYLYQAVDSQGNTIDFLLRANKNKTAATRFLKQALNAYDSAAPRIINLDKNAYPHAIDSLKSEGILSQECMVKYINNIDEQDNHFIRRDAKLGIGFKSFPSARRAPKGYEIINRIRKGQIERIKKASSRGKFNSSKICFWSPHRNPLFRDSFILQSFLQQNPRERWPA